MVRHRIVLTGGGTGGHIYPALAVAEELKGDPDVESILYIGAKGHLEEKLAARYGLDFVGLSVSGLPRKLSPTLISWPCQALAAIRQAISLFRKFQPTAVLGTGGYASFPALFAALLSSVPYAIHEPDAHPGLVNRLFARRARLCSLGMEGALKAFRMISPSKIRVNGNPVRKSFANLLSRESACAVIGLKTDLKTVLITGGSQGARALNEAVIDALPELMKLDPPIQVVHQVGEKNWQECKQRVGAGISHSRYFLKAYFDDLAIAYAATDLAVSRAGAMTIAELAVTGTPAIFVPYPYAAQDHQSHNARFIQSKGAAIVLPQTELSGERLCELIVSLITDEAKLKSMRDHMLALGSPTSAHILAQQIKELSVDYSSGKERHRTQF